MNGSVRPTLRSWLGLIALVALAWGGTQGLSLWQDARAASAIREHSQRVDITLYTTSTCPYCAQAKAWLKRHEVRWRECNVETDAACARTYAEQGAPGVPLVRAGERWHLGFHAPWLAEALAAQDSEAPPAVTPFQPASPNGASSPRP
jgi:glutaredoxin